MNSRAVGGALAALLGGFLAAAGGATTWLTREGVRLVGGVQIPDAQVYPGTQFAPLVLPLGLLVIVLAALALAIKGPARRVLAASLAATGVALFSADTVGLLRIVGLQGRISAAPWLAMSAGLVVLGGAWSLWRQAATSAPVLDQRYTVEGSAAEDPDAQEWRLAEDEPDS